MSEHSSLQGIVIVTYFVVAGHEAAAPSTACLVPFHGK
jgi:hypothetical protein